MKAITLAAVTVMISFLPPLAVSGAAAQDLVIGTGPADSVEYKVGRALCHLLERALKGHDCLALATEGSAFNLSNVEGGAIEFGISFSDRDFHAVNKSGPYAFVDESFDRLRSVLALHSRLFTVVALRGSGVERWADLAGRRLSIGDPGSPEHSLAARVIAASGWSKASFRLVGALPAEQQSMPLCHGRYEAAVYLLTHPNDTVRRLVDRCEATIVTVAGPEAEKVLADAPWLVRGVVPANLYDGLERDVETIGLRATLVTSSEVDPALIYQVVAAVFGDLDRLRRAHPALAGLGEAMMVRDGLAAPLHDGAARYYAERGLR